MHGNYIDGEWIPARGGRMVPDRNPAHADMILGEFPDSTAADVADAVAAATAAFPAWRALPMPRRGEILFRAAELLGQRSAEIAQIITREQGKTLAEAHAEVQWSTGVLRFFASEALQPQGQAYPAHTPAALLYTQRHPLGAIGVITPWNFPLALPAAKLAPALVYGNTVVFKPAALTPLSAALLIGLLVEAGMPRGVLNLVHGRGAVVGEAIVGHQRLAAVSFTGSRGVARTIQRRLFERSARLQFEVGGKSPLIVLRDADLELAVRWTVKGAMHMAGQSCTAISHVIVEQPVLDAFTQRLVASVRALKIGDGLDPATAVGPVISEAQQSRILDYFHTGIGEGADVLIGGDALENEGYEEGYFVAPTVFGNVQPRMRIMQDEIYGPVVCIIAAYDLPHAIALANAIPFGVSTSFATRDLNTMLRYIDRIATRVVHVNREPTHMDFHTPLAGVQSALASGCDLGKTARDFFTETKTVYLQGTAE